MAKEYYSKRGEGLKYKIKDNHVPIHCITFIADNRSFIENLHNYCTNEWKHKDN